MDLKELYEKYGGKLFGFCLTLTRNRADAEDLAAETLYRAVRKADSFRGESDLGVWLCAIARNLFLDEARKKRRAVKSEPPPDPFSRIEDREDATRILVAMNALEEPYRGVFFLRTVGDLSPKEVGEIYKKSENWVSVTYFRAKAKIIEKLEE